MVVTGNGKKGELEARRWIEDKGFIVHNANVIFRANCPNIDLIVYTKTCARYVQVKFSEKPAGKDCITLDGSPWTQAQLEGTAPIFNKHDSFRANF